MSTLFCGRSFARWLTATCNYSEWNALISIISSGFLLPSFLHSFVRSHLPTLSSSSFHLSPTTRVSPLPSTPGTLSPLPLSPPPPPTNCLSEINAPSPKRLLRTQFFIPHEWRPSWLFMSGSLPPGKIVPYLYGRSYWMDGQEAVFAYRSGY